MTEEEIVERTAQDIDRLPLPLNESPEYFWAPHLNEANVRSLTEGMPLEPLAEFEEDGEWVWSKRYWGDTRLDEAFLARQRALRMREMNA